MKIETEKRNRSAWNTNQRRGISTRQITCLSVTSCIVFSFVLTSSWGSEKPNLLLILADDLGVETLGCYGGRTYETPHLDRLASQGMRFDHCYSMAVCHPTRLTLMTGRYPFRWSHPRWGTFPKDAEEVSLGRLLQDRGYTTAVAGKWQLTLLKDDLDHPYRLGFDEYCLFGWHEGARYFDPWIYENGKQRNDVSDQYGPDVYTDFLIDFMKRNRKNPFCAFYSMALCHDVTDDLANPVPYGPKGRYENYREMVESMDQKIGRLMQALEDLQLEDNTVVVFTSDNGTPQRMILTAENGQYQRVPVQSDWRGTLIPGGKGKLTDSGTHVPMIVRWPAAIHGGQKTDALVDMSDFLPSFHELTGANPSPSKVDGVSFVSTLLNPAQSNRSWVFAEHGKKSWVRDRQWKLYNNGELFQVHDFDQEERVEMSQLDPTQQKQVTRLKQAQVDLK